MEYRRFGKTDLNVSVIGFGAWAIGGPSMAGATPIGWGAVDDATSVRALERSRHLGVNFYDTADFYGLGHSEELIGRTFGGSQDVIIATKVGHRLGSDGRIVLDYSRQHIIEACEASLRRLRRETIDLYQLHSARVSHFEQGECIDAMEQLRTEGKIRYWGVSLNTFHPAAEAGWLMERNRGDGFQLVLNIVNQRAVPLLTQAHEKGFGIIVRMPLQFGLLTGKIGPETTFSANDHRSFRLTPEVLHTALGALEEVWPIAERHNISKTTLSLSFCAAFPEVSTIIPGIKTPEQAAKNAHLFVLPGSDREALERSYREKLHTVVDVMERCG